MKVLKSFGIVDTHTQGEPTRIIVSGLPFISRKNMIEVKEEIRQNYDYIRKILMLEPRGHSGMFGAIITPPVDDDCDFGIVFIDTGGYLNMCGHGSIGVAKYAIESGLVEKRYPLTTIKANTPSGKIELNVNFDKDKNIRSVSLLNVKSFNYLSNVRVDIDNMKIYLDISFGGNFFAIVDADKINISLSIKNIDVITKLGVKILKYLNENIKVEHPEERRISSIDLVEFNSKIGLEGSNNKNVVVFSNGKFDRSPCGTGTSAKMANLYSQGKLGVGDEFINESIIGTKFIGKVIREDNSGSIKGIIPQITANAFITGYNNIIVEKDDPLGEGFIV